MTANYILALRLYIRRRAEKARGGVVSVRIRDVCSGDKRCEYVITALMKSLIKKGIAQRRKQGVYLIEKSALELI
jgi:predicted transcriptional regulator of viral defense system